MDKITIHTATYNRAYILGKAYDSLRAQTCKQFEWIITDDGSTDETEQLVMHWQKQRNGFDIIYNKLEHVGIPRALNSGINLAHTDWFMMLDSDDSIAPDTVELVLKWLGEIEHDKNFVGIGYAKCHPDGTYMKDQTPIIDSKLGYVDATNIERKKYNLNMDMEEVTRVSLLKKFPFQYWVTEKYAPEQLNYNEIALAGYKYRWYDKKLYFCDYLPDGQTRDNRLVKNNPMGFAMMYNQNMLIADNLKEKCYCAIQMVALSLYSKNPSYIFKTNNRLITFLVFPAGIALAIRRRRQFSQME
ncbi:MAG: glycosyltransferase family 2 protein [Oliverpabstia sp.]